MSPYIVFLLMDMLTEDTIKDVPTSMMIAGDIVLCGDEETDTTAYLDTWRRGGREAADRKPKSWTLNSVRTI